MTPTERLAVEKNAKMVGFVWNELVSTDEAAVRLYKQEMTAFCTQILTECRWWVLKADAAGAMEQVAVHTTLHMEVAEFGRCTCCIACERADCVRPEVDCVT